jgi:integrase
MPKVNLTSRFVSSTAAPASGRVEHWDTVVRGLGLRVTSNGAKSWVVMYRHQGRKRRLTLGTFPPLPLADARRQAAEALRGVALGKDPAGRKKEERAAETFGDIAEQYVEIYAKKEKRSWLEDRRALDRDLLPRFKHRKAASITRRELRKLLREIVDRGAPILANRTLEIARRIYNWALDEEIESVEVNPFAGMKPISEAKRRDRVLSDDEVLKVWDKVTVEKATTAARYRLGLLTGQRPGEIRKMRWQDLDLGSGWWTIPGEFTKNARMHRVPLAGLAVLILKELATQQMHPEWVFPSQTRNGSVRANTNQVARIRKATGVDFTPHDLRRTVGTNITGLGFSRFVMHRVLNHTESGVGEVYDLYEYDREKRAALEAWSRRLEEIIAGKPASDSNVAELRRA